MKKKLYFENEDSEYCYTEEYFLDEMKEEGISKKQVLEAIPDKMDDIFWCKYYGTIEDRNIDNPCGLTCENYSPRNGKSGCCRHYTNTIYKHGDPIVLINPQT